MVIPKGTLFLCPKCLQPQAKLIKPLGKHQKIINRLEFLLGKVKMKGQVTTLSRCCFQTWHHQGSFFTDQGWQPFQSDHNL